MSAREYIDNNLQPLGVDSLVKEAIDYFAENKLNETFIYVDNQELGLLKLQDIIHQRVTLQAKLFATPFELKLSGNLHWSQLLAFYNLLKIQVLPVYDQNYYLIGLISKSNLVSSIADFKSLEEPGAILQLGCDPHFYAASEVIRIAEMYDARVVALLTHLDLDSNKFIVTLKLSIQETKGITSTYERFGYEVTTVFMNKDFENDVYIDRYESFLRVFDMK